jgi:hypothetical protein
MQPLLRKQVLVEWASKEYTHAKRNNTDHLLYIHEDEDLVPIFEQFNKEVEKALGLDNSGYSYQERLNRTIHSLAKTLLNASEAEKQKLMSKEGARKLMEYAYDEVIHIFVGPVQKSGGNHELPENLTEIDQDLLTLPLATVQMARMKAFFKVKMSSIDDIGALKRFFETI